MAPLYDVATQTLTKVFDDEECFGITVVTPSREINRPMLLAWALATFPEVIDPKHSFNGLFVTDQPDHLAWLSQEVLRRRRKHWRDEPSLVIAAQQDDLLLNPLPCFTLTTHKVIKGQAERFEEYSLNLLILDEYHPGNMADLKEFVDRVQPGLTMFVTKQTLPAGSPWEKLGKSLVLNRATFPRKPPRRRSRRSTRGGNGQ